ncbi:MAG: DUF2335 domain-containing protein [Schwartzia sp.]|nr:DUF2335 domain-containing protein [Schwartzia sp. (in: firmicutes)]
MGKQNKPEAVQNSNTLAGLQVTNQYVGPLPPPAIMRGFGDIDSSFPERIMSEFEQNSEHTRAQEVKALQAQIEETKRGQYMAISIIGAGLAGTFLLAYLDKDVASAATGICTAMLIFKGIFKK